MTADEARVAAFMERVVTYERNYYANRVNELGLLDDNPDGITLGLRDGARKWGKLASVAQLQCRRLIEEANLPPLYRRVMILRYSSIRTWTYIARNVKKTKRYVYMIRLKSFEMMVPAMRRLYPDWQIGDE